MAAQRLKQKRSPREKVKRDASVSDDETRNVGYLRGTRVVHWVLTQWGYNPQVTCKYPLVPYLAGIVAPDDPVSTVGDSPGSAEEAELCSQSLSTLYIAGTCQSSRVSPRSLFGDDSDDQSRSDSRSNGQTSEWTSQTLSLKNPSGARGKRSIGAPF